MIQVVLLNESASSVQSRLAQGEQRGDPAAHAAPGITRGSLASNDRWLR